VEEDIVAIPADQSEQGQATRQVPWVGDPWRSGFLAVSLVALVKIVVHLATTGAFGYEFFVDELYFLACSEHLAWGFVDMPPLMPALTALERLLIGDSLLATRVLVTLAGGATVLLTGLLAREMGGRRFAQGLAAVAVLGAPVLLACGAYNSMNGYEPLWWLGCAWVLARLANGGSQRWWLLFGLLGGLALLTKHTALLYGFAAVAGVVVTGQRRFLRQPWFWLAGAVAAVLFLPNLLWMIDHGFPHMELLANIKLDGRDVTLSPVGFLAGQVFMAGPIGVVLAVAGCAWLLAGRTPRYRHLGVMLVVALATLIIVHARVYYSAALWAPALAAGSVAFERRLSSSSRAWLRVAVLCGTAFAGVLMAPLVLPCLPPDLYLRYTSLIRIGQPRFETHGQGVLPQLFADRIGWRELTETVARVYHSLPAEDQRRAAIFAQSFGEAGAIDHYGPGLGLPKAISGHLTYWYWGPRDADGSVVIVLGDRPERLEELFAHVDLAAYIYHPLAMPRWTQPVWVCRGLKIPMEKLWAQVKSFH